MLCIDSNQNTHKSDRFGVAAALKLSQYYFPQFIHIYCRFTAGYNGFAAAATTASSTHLATAVASSAKCSPLSNNQQPVFPWMKMNGEWHFFVAKFAWVPLHRTPPPISYLQGAAGAEEICGWFLQIRKTKGWAGEWICMSPQAIIDSAFSEEILPEYGNSFSRLNRLLEFFGVSV